MSENPEPKVPEYLGWPVSEGPHWIEMDTMVATCPVLARYEGSEIVVNSIFNSTIWMKRSEYECFAKVLRFASLAEKSPFQTEAHHRIELARQAKEEG